jgi:hypothetical protein
MVNGESRTDCRLRPWGCVSRAGTSAPPGTSTDTSDDPVNLAVEHRIQCNAFALKRPQVFAAEKMIVCPPERTAQSKQDHKEAHPLKLRAEAFIKL